MANAVDKEQIQMLSDWWKTYGKSIMTAIILGVVIVLGWRYWDGYKVHHQDQAATLYRTLFSEATSNDATGMMSSLTQLKTRFSDTPYASMGVMLAARAHAQTQELSKALDELKWVIEKSKAKDFRQFARLSAAQILLSQKQYPEAKTMLATIENKAYQALVDNLLGQIYLAEGDSTKAKQFFLSAKSGFQEAGINDTLMDMQLSALQSSLDK